MSRFLKALHSGRVLLMDGAMGTELRRAGLPDDACGELWNVTNPDRVRAIHQAYVNAGAQCLLTNTFQAHPGRISQLGLHEKLSVINEQALNLAREAAGENRFVLFDAGPFGEEWRRHAAACALAFAYQGNVDALLLETCSGIADLARVVKGRTRSAMKRGSLLFLLSWTFRRTPEGLLCTYHGRSPEACAKESKPYPIAALGVNCGRDIGMDEIIETIRRYRQVTDLPLFARPNAGTPTQVDGRWVYPRTPAMMAARLPELLEAGVSMVGGCCGTTPEHIAAFRPIIDDWNVQHGH